MTKEPLNTIVHDGFHFPEKDEQCWKAVFRTLDDLELALHSVKKFGTAIQAGGNVGVWPKAMSKRFSHTITFEPDSKNYTCLLYNLRQEIELEKVTAFRAALGDTVGTVGLATDPKNIGAHYINGKGSIPIFKIDELSLSSLDFICLDIEGYELKALQGAADYIQRFRPVIQIEDKGLSVKYGVQKGDAGRWLAEEFGYVVKHRVNRDLILVAS